MVSLKDIAAELDISIGLISKVLNDRMGTTRVSPRIRNRIVKKAQAMGYVPNRNAQALLSGKKGAIGIFISPWGEVGTEFIYTFLLGASDCLKATPFHLWLNFFRHDGEFHELMDIQDMRHRIDGMVVAGHPSEKLLPHLRKIEKAGMPVVTSFEGIGAALPVNIAIDNYQQGFLPTDHLIYKGCTRIAHFNTAEARYQGYLGALRRAGHRVNPALIVKCARYSIADGRAAVRKLIQSGVAFDSIVAQSDNQAYGACVELLDRGIGVPDQVRIIGVDDSPMCVASPVSLSSVTSECAQVGFLAIEAMLKKLNGEKVEPKLVVPRVIERNST